MKMNEIVKESMTAGSVATVAQPLGGMIKRNPTKKKPAKKKNDK
jgi:hypothetical protein